jgi:hypothetical protein
MTEKDYKNQNINFSNEDLNKLKKEIKK